MAVSKVQKISEQNTEPSKQEPDQTPTEDSPMNIDDIRKISLVAVSISWDISLPDATAKVCGFTPRIAVRDKPSFHVNPNRRVWFDFRTGAGGDIFSLAGEMSGETDFLS